MSNPKEAKFEIVVSAIEEGLQCADFVEGRLC